MRRDFVNRAFRPQPGIEVYEETTGEISRRPFEIEGADVRGFIKGALNREHEDVAALEEMIDRLEQQFARNPEQIEILQQIAVLNRDIQQARMGRTALDRALPNVGSRYDVMDFDEDLQQKVSRPGQYLLKAPVSFGRNLNTDFIENPTSSTFSKANRNMGRARTLAAVYDSQEQMLTVIFRDSTFYNYETVSLEEWQAFRTSQSKGKYIRENLDSKNRGPADMSKIPNDLRVALAASAQMLQQAAGGVSLTRSETYRKDGGLRKNVPKYTRARRGNKRKYR